PASTVPAPPAEQRPSIELADAGAVPLRRRLHRARQLVVAVRLRGSALLLERAAERIVSVVVGGVELIGDRPELALRVLPPGQPEIGDAERLADRGLLRLQPLRLLERHGRLRRQPRAKPPLPFSKKVV